jgi:hypothetical protein
MHKEGLSSIVTHSYMFRPCWVIFRENFFVIVTLRLHFIVEWECAVVCVLRCFWRRELSAIPACRPARFVCSVFSQRFQPGTSRKYVNSLTTWTSFAGLRSFLLVKWKWENHGSNFVPPSQFLCILPDLDYFESQVRTGWILSYFSSFKPV